MNLPATYEYAGFSYTIDRNAQGWLSATPLPDQHPAASKDKHRRAAVECFTQDHGDK